MNKSNLIILFSLTLLLTGCNPFSKGSVINIIDSNPDLSGTTTEINSGGKTDLTTPQSGNPADVHSISYSVGNSLRQTSFTTPNGHSVNVSISGSKRE